MENIRIWWNCSKTLVDDQ